MSQVKKGHFHEEEEDEEDGHNVLLYPSTPQHVRATILSCCGCPYAVLPSSGIWNQMCCHQTSPEHRPVSKQRSENIEGLSSVMGCVVCCRFWQARTRKKSRYTISAKRQGAYVCVCVVLVRKCVGALACVCV